jgi:hypothetical protein
MSGSAKKLRRGGRVTILLVMAAAAAASALLGPTARRSTAFGQNAKTAPGPASGPGDKKPDDPVGSYSLVTTAFELSPATHLLNPPLTIAVDGGTERAPGDFAGEKPVPAQAAIEKFGSPWYECLPAVAKLHGCDALDRASLTIRDANTVAYHIVSHGAAVTLSLNVEVHDLLPVSQGSAETPWKSRDVLYVAVPKATPVYRFSSEILVGTWNGEPIVFELGKPLPDSAKKGLEDLGLKQDLGDRILYGFRVK